MSVRGDAAPRGMTAHDRIRLTGPFADFSTSRWSHRSIRKKTTALAGRTSGWGWPFLGEGAGATFPFAAAGSRYDKDMLRVKLLEAGARAPVVAHPGEDLGYDLFAFEGVVLAPRVTVKVRTGIAVEARHPVTGEPLGLLVRDRSSMAARGIATTAGVIDAGYRGEILILMTNLGETAVELKAGEKIAQMIPMPVLTGGVQEVESLEESARAAKGFGSSGR